MSGDSRSNFDLEPNPFERSFATKDSSLSLSTTAGHQSRHESSSEIDTAGNSSAYSNSKANLAFTGIQDPHEQQTHVQQQQQIQHQPLQNHHPTKLPGITPPLFTPGGRRLPPLEPTSNPGTPTTNLWNSLLSASNGSTNPLPQQNGQLHPAQQSYNQFASRKTGLTPNESNLRSGLTPGGFSFGFGGQVGTGLSTPGGLLNGPITPGLSSLLGIPSGNNNILMGMPHGGVPNPGPSQMQQSQSTPSQHQLQSQEHPQSQVLQPQVPHPDTQQQQQQQQQPHQPHQLTQSLPQIGASPPVNNQQIALVPPSVLPENSKFLQQPVEPPGMASQEPLTTQQEHQRPLPTLTEPSSIQSAHASSHQALHSSSQNPSSEVLSTVTNSASPNPTNPSVASDLKVKSVDLLKKKKGRTAGVKKPRATKPKKATVKVKEEPGVEKSVNSDDKENHANGPSEATGDGAKKTEMKQAGGKRKNSTNEEEKRKSFLERNRVAASKCRQRKKQLMQKMEDELAFYSNGYRETSAQVTELRAHLQKMTSILIAHKDCPSLAQSCGGIEDLSSIIQEAEHLAKDTVETEDQVSSIPSTIPTTLH
ncbi:SKO1 [Candida theae]|uniref:SKO1 n=1 Tax=Candida theae TaxID=1198502 RepID=A0AAD5BIH5_9ASCO|nr:SKO1 [Candida theae]KAI5966611.1 SKO1 [Candida theae]